MESSTFIIGIADIKELTPINSLVDNNVVEPSQRQAHTILEKILGRALYDEIQTAIDADATLSGEADLSLLVEWYIKPYVAQLTWYNAIYPIHYQTSKTGIQTKSDNGYDAVSIEVLKELRTDASSKVDEYGEQLIKYLYVNKATYPNFSVTSTSEERATRIVSGGGVYFPRRAKLYYDENFKGINDKEITDTE